MTGTIFNISFSESDDVNISFNLRFFKNKKTNTHMADECGKNSDSRTEIKKEEECKRKATMLFGKFLLDTDKKMKRYFLEKSKHEMENKENSSGSAQLFPCEEKICHCSEDANLPFSCCSNKENNFFQNEKKPGEDKCQDLPINSRNIQFSHPFRRHWTSYKFKNISAIKRLKTSGLKRSYSLPTQKLQTNETQNYIDFWQTVDNGVKFTLPVTSLGASDSLPRITPEVLWEALETSQHAIQIIDCRFDYEYVGGHVRNAINIDNTDLLTRKVDLFRNHILVFYCEFSSIRAPRIAKYLRNYDRFNNEYPNLDFPEIYVLDGGYKGFYEKCKNFCRPRNYIKMKI